MPSGEHEIEDREGGARCGDDSRGGRDHGEFQCGTEHPARCAEQEERRHDDGEHEMLHHMTREQIEVGDVVDWSVD